MKGGHITNHIAVVGNSSYGLCGKQNSREDFAHDLYRYQGKFAEYKVCKKCMDLASLEILSELNI